LSEFVSERKRVYVWERVSVRDRVRECERAHLRSVIHWRSHAGGGLQG